MPVLGRQTTCRRVRNAVIAVLVAVSLGAAWPARLSAAGNKVEPRLVRLSIEPKSIFLSNPSASQTVVVTGTRADGSTVDLTGSSKLKTSRENVARIDNNAVIRGVAPGSAYVQAAAGGLEAQAFVVVRDGTATRSFSFSTDIAPIFTRFGCNSSNCHGSLTGQNGFKLSLFGYEPDADYDAMVKGSDGRRVKLDQPESSLLVQKPTFSVNHGGGQLMAKDSPEYRRLIEWLRQGAPKGTPGAPRLEKLEVYPREPRVLASAGQEHRLVVVGRYSDGSEADMTREVSFASNNEAVASVTRRGVIRANASGETAIMVRSLGAVGVARVAVVLRPPAGGFPRLEAANFVDDFVFEKLRRLRMAPSPLTTDEEFIRRASLDLTGTLPEPDEVRRFLADRSPGKRARLADSLLAKPEFNDFWAMKWGDLFTNTPQFLYNGTAYFQAWMRAALASNTPYDEFARSLITATGATYEATPANFYSVMKNPEEMATFVGQSFLGVSLECARCHDHPSENWRREDFLGVAAFFSQVRFKGGARNNERFLYIDPERQFNHPQTKKPVNPRFLGGETVAFEPEEDRRARFARWLTSPSNPYFARTAVNRVWRELMGRGIVDPVDDFRLTNPPSHPELLDRLAADFVENGYDLRRLMRRIVNSTAYQLSARPNSTNRDDSGAFSRYYVRRLGAEQLLDAIAQVTEVPEKFPYFHPGKRAIELPDPIVDSYFLTVFDRASRENATCTRRQSASLTQSLHLVGGNTVNGRVQSERNVLARLIREGRTDAQIVEHLYLAALSRYPGSEEREWAAAAVARAPNRRAGLEDVLWAILNSKEFLYNH